MTPMTFVCWKWTTAGYRSAFGPKTVNTLRRMVARHYPRPHRFCCVTNDAAGLDPEVEVVHDREDFKDLPPPTGGRNPSCYRRLRAFRPDIAEVFGPRFLSMDLDMVIVGDLRPIVDRPEDFIIWGDTNPRTFYNGSLFMMTAGARPQVWTTFDPVRSPQAAKAVGHHGSDQGWISHCLGPKEAKWSKADGVYSYQNDIREQHPTHLPDNARIVVFHGLKDPWHPDVRERHPWVREHYTLESEVAR